MLLLLIHNISLRCFCCIFYRFAFASADALQRRVASSSYAPRAGTPEHEPFFSALRALYDTHHPPALCYDSDVFVFGDTYDVAVERFLVSELQLPVVTVHHAPIVTCDEHAVVLAPHPAGCAARNVFLRAKRTGALYLATAPAAVRVDLDALAAQLGLAKKDALRLAPDEKLRAFGVFKGAVTPLAYYVQRRVLPAQCATHAPETVAFCVHRDIATAADDALLYFHPCVNSKTLGISAGAFRTFLRALNVDFVTFG